MAIITLAEVKSFLGISSTDHDATITALIPEVESWLELYLNEDFSEGEYPSGIKYPFSQLINYDLFSRPKGQGASSETIGGYSITYDFRTVDGYPNNILELFTIFKTAPTITFV